MGRMALGANDRRLSRLIASAALGLAGGCAASPLSGPDRPAPESPNRPRTAADVRILEPLSGDRQWGDAGEALRRPLVAYVGDASGLPIAGVPVVFSVTAGGGRLRDTVAFTDENGQASLLTWTLGPSERTQSVEARIEARRIRFVAYLLEREAPMPHDLLFVRDQSVFDWPRSASRPTRRAPLPVGISADARLSSDRAWLATKSYSPAPLLCVIGLESRVPRCVATPQFYDVTLEAMHPDNSHLLFTATELTPCASGFCPANDNVLFVLDLRTSRITAIFSGAFDGNYISGASWSPDGMQISFAVNGEAWIVNANGTRPRAVTEAVSARTPIYRTQFSPDGRRLALAMTDGSACRTACSDRVGVFELGTGDMRLLPASPETATRIDRLQWSADGSQIAFTQYIGGWSAPDAAALPAIWTVAVRGGTPVRLLWGGELLSWQ